MGLFDNLKKSKTPASAKSAAPAQSVSTPKRFDAPYEFDFIYQELMRFAATLHDPDELMVSITAYQRAYDGHPAGEIELRLSTPRSLQARMHILYKDDTSSNKGLYNLFFDSTYYSGNAICYRFTEPDCYIFGCPEAHFRQESEKNCAHAYVDFYRQFPNGMLTVIIKFHSLPADEIYDNIGEYRRYNRVVFGL